MPVWSRLSSSAMVARRTFSSSSLAAAVLLLNTPGAHAFWENSNTVGWTFMAVGVVVVFIVCFLLYTCRRKQRVEKSRWQTANAARLQDMIAVWDQRSRAGSTKQGGPKKFSVYAQHTTTTRTNEVWDRSPEGTLGSVRMRDPSKEKRDTIDELLNMPAKYYMGGNLNFDEPAYSSISGKKALQYPVHNRQELEQEAWNRYDLNQLNDLNRPELNETTSRVPILKNRLNMPEQPFEESEWDGGSTLQYANTAGGSTGYVNDLTANTESLLFNTVKRKSYQRKANSMNDLSQPYAASPRSQSGTLAGDYGYANVAPKPRVMRDFDIYLTGEGLHSAVVGETATVEVQQVPSLGGQCSITLDGVGANPTISIRELTSGLWRVEYIPITPGTYTMMIEVNEEMVPGSPFEVKVLPKVSKAKSMDNIYQNPRLGMGSTEEEDELELGV